MGWQIRSGVNDGYPLHTDNPDIQPTGLAAPYPHIMACQNDDVNDGYPTFLDNQLFSEPGLAAPYPNGIMRIDGETNDGYPFLWWMEPPPIDTGVNKLYMHGQRPQRLYYGESVVQACYYGGALVYRPSAGE